MKIISATYGDVDVTRQLQSKVTNNKIYIRSDNNICGDPVLGKVKYLIVKAEVNGKVIEEIVKEGDLLSLSESSDVDRLGIFYADNNDNRVRDTIVYGLKRIEKAAAGKADILTNLWNSEPENPFYEFISWTKTRSHLNQVLQILELLYFARESKEYKYVSFLESDVLYAEGHFDYPDFEGNSICNMNYKGLCDKGFQERQQHDKPHSQLTMKFDKAIDHFMRILPNALVRNAGSPEPQEEIGVWQSKNTSLHVNHGRHFTSHYSIYSKSDTYKDDPYWGNYKDYLNLFEGMKK